MGASGRSVAGGQGEGAWGKKMSCRQDRPRAAGLQDKVQAGKYFQCNGNLLGGLTGE